MIKLKSDYKRIAENIFSLSILNGINYIFPLILIPYLTRVVGVDNFGKYSFAYSFLLYFTMVVSYGFDLSATKKIAINRHNMQKVQSIFSNILYARLFLSLICIIVLLFLAYFIDKLHADLFLFLPGIGFIISYAINPIWLYLGLEQMKFITIVSFIARSSTLVLILLFVKEQSDYIYINLYFAIGLLLSAVVSFVISIAQFKLKLSKSSLADIKSELTDGWHIFISTIFMNFYRNSNVIILGFVASYEIVGIYAAAEKIIKAFQSIFSPITNALFPFFGRKLNSGSNSSAFQQYFKFSRYYSILLFIISLLLLFLSEPLIKTYLPVEFLSSISDIRIMSFVILFGGLNYFYGINGLINIGSQKHFTFSVFIAGLFSLISCFFLSKIFEDKGASVSMLVTEILLFFLIYFFFKRQIKKHD